MHIRKQRARLSLVKMSATDRNSLVPFDQDLKYTIKLKERVKSVRNISAIHTGKNAIIPSSMSYLLGWNYCGAALYLVPGQQLGNDWKRSIEPHDNRKFIYDLQALSQCNYFAVELSGLSQENL